MARPNARLPNDSLAWRYFAVQSGGDDMGSAGKDAVLGRCWRAGEFLDQACAHVQLRIVLAQTQQSFNRLPALFRGENLGRHRADLRRKDAHPYFSDFRPWRPKTEEFVQISNSFRHS